MGVGENIMIKKYEKKIKDRHTIKCPICQKRLMDYRAGIETYVSPIDIDEDDTADFFTKCRHCGKVIGIRKIS